MIRGIFCLLLVISIGLLGSQRYGRGGRRRGLRPASIGKGLEVDPSDLEKTPEDSQKEASERGYKEDVILARRRLEEATARFIEIKRRVNAVRLVEEQLLAEDEIALRDAGEELTRAREAVGDAEDAYKEALYGPCFRCD